MLIIEKVTRVPIKNEEQVERAQELGLKVEREAVMMSLDFFKGPFALEVADYILFGKTEDYSELERLVAKSLANQAKALDLE